MQRQCRKCKKPSLDMNVSFKWAIAVETGCQQQIQEKLTHPGNLIQQILNTSLSAGASELAARRQQSPSLQIYLSFKRLRLTTHYGLAGVIKTRANHLLSPSAAGASVRPVNNSRRLKPRPRACWEPSGLGDKDTSSMTTVVLGSCRHVWK